MRARTADPRVRGRYLAWLVVSVRGSLHSGVRALLRLDARARGGQTCVACRCEDGVGAYGGPAPRAR
jgi:hypothetical protein